MRERETIHKLIEAGTVDQTLRQGSPARHAVAALQTLLHWLGFDPQLEWARFGADGGYGKATTAAVFELARRNGSTAKGERVTAVLAGKILDLYDSLEELKQLDDDVAGQKPERWYRRGGGDRIRIASLQTLLNALGFGEELKWAKFGADGGYGRATRSAVRAFAAREGLEGDGDTLTLPLAERIVALLGPRYGDGWHSPDHSAKPAPGSLSIKAVVGKKNRQYFKVSDGVHTKQFQKLRLGLVTMGGQKPSTFVESHQDKLRGVTQSEVNVMLAVAENEGNLDAVNTWDNAFLSCGLFQWTIGTGSGRGELPALLARVKIENPDLFDKYCGQHGIDVTDLRPTDWETSKTGPVTGRLKVMGQVIKTPAQKELFRQAPWAFYFWLAGQDPDVHAMEIRHALARLEQFYSTDDYTVGEEKYQVSELVTSEYGVGLILDNHVNRPAYVGKCLEKALTETGLSDPASWGTEEERRLIDAYLAIRVTYGRSPMTDAEKRARVTKKYLTRGVISDQRGSFQRGK